MSISKIAKYRPLKHLTTQFVVPADAPAASKHLRPWLVPGNYCELLGVSEHLFRVHFFKAPRGIEDLLSREDVINISDVVN